MNEDDRPNPLGASVRIAGIDAVRYAMCFAIILVHTLPTVAGHTNETWSTALASLCRSAVPFFFIASGYFLRVPERLSARTMLRPLRRLLPIYLFWFAVYAVAESAMRGWFVRPAMKSLVTGGVAFHLWFIPALAAALVVVPAGLIIGRKATIFVAVLIAAGGLVFGAYHVALGLPPSPAVRWSMGPIFVLIGNQLRSQKQVSYRASIPAILVTTLSVIGEEYLIAKMSHTAPTSHDIVLSTCALGPAVFLFARSLPASAAVMRMNRLGRLTLGIYANHLLVLWALRERIGDQQPLECISLALVTLVAATLLTALLARVPFIKHVVT